MNHLYTISRPPNVIVIAINMLAEDVIKQAIKDLSFPV